MSDVKNEIIDRIVSMLKNNRDGKLAKDMGLDPNDPNFDKLLDHIAENLKRANRYPIMGQFGNDWQTFLPSIIRMDGITYAQWNYFVKELVQTSNKLYKGQYSLIASIRFLLQSYFDNGQNNSILYYNVNRMALEMFWQYNYTENEVVEMLKKYTLEFDSLSQLCRKDLSERDGLLYTIIMINILSYRVVSSDVPGVYMLEGIEKYFFQGLFDLIKNNAQ